MLKSGRSFAVLLFIFISIITLPNDVAAADDQLLFDRVLTISNWHVHASQHSFNAADAQKARIKISKNSPDGEIQQGFFVLNGTFTFLRDFLVNGEPFFEKDVTVQAANTLFVFLLGQPAAAISCQIIADDALPPAPQITAFTAEPSVIKRGQSATLSWQTIYADSCVIEPAVGAVDPVGTRSVVPTVDTSYTLTAEGTGEPATATVTVTVENSAPVAEPQMVTTDEDTAASISLSASDVDGDSLTFTITAGPQKGILSGPAPLLTYTPDENYHGPDSFSFKANDGRTDSNTAAVSLQINAVNDAPLAQAGPDRNVFVGAAVLLDGSASSDVDEDILTFSWSVALRPAGSSAVLSGPSVVNPTFIPDIAGTYEIQLIVKDGKVESVPDKVTINAELRKVAVPDVVDLLKTDAEALLNSAGLFIGTISTVNNDSVLLDHVISQDPAAGISVADGTAVDLIISLGPKPSPDDVDFGFADNEQQGGGGLVGKTIRILNGNALVHRFDLGFPSPHRLGLSFQAVYNSRSGARGDSGFGWTHTYEAYCDPAFIIDGQDYMRIVDQTGRAHYFAEDTPGVYQGEFNERTHVKAESGDFVWYLMDGSRYGFSAAGRLIWIDDQKGNRLSLTYGADNRLAAVTDTVSGRNLTFYYVDGLLDHIAGPVTAAVSDGIWASYEYGPAQNLTAVIYADGSGFSYTYDDANDDHNITEIRNQSDHLLNTWTYDDQDRCIDNFSADGSGATLSYVGASQVNVIDAYGAVRAYTLSPISGRKRVAAMQGPAGAPYNGSNITGWKYDTSMNLTEIATTGGAIHEYQNHDSRGNPQTIIFASGTAEQRTIAYTYHPEINAPLTRTEASVLGAGNKVTTWDFDDDYDSTPNENPTRLIARLVEQGFTKDAAGATVPYEYVTTFTYNSKGQVLSIDGPLAGTTDTTSFAYEATTGNLLSVTQPLIGASGFSGYDAAGQPGTVTDVNGQSETFTYDGRGRITEITHEADGSTKTVAYNTAGRPHMIVDEDGVYHAFEYDESYGRLVRKNDMDGNYIAYTYDTRGNLIERSKHSASDEIFSQKRWDYQHPVIPGKLWKEIKYDDSYAEYGYDSDGNINSVTDFNLNTTTYEYDSLSRLVTVTRPGSTVTSYDYDLHGNLISVMDAENQETTFTYDDMGRVVSQTSPDTGTTTYAYDAAGNLAQKADAKSITVQYGYDDLNRLTDVQFPDPAQDMVYSYDAGTNGKGRRTGMTDPAGSTTFGYDSRGRLTGKTATVSGVPYAISRSYTPGGRLTSFVYPTGRTVDFTRYGNGKTQNVSTTYNSTTADLFSNMTYDPFGRPSKMETGTGSDVSNQSGACNCLEKINPGQMMEQIYTHDSNGNITDITATNVSWLSQSFVYDELNRLESATGLYGTIDYSYDKVGNRLTRAVGGQTDTYSYVSGTNRLDQITGPNAADFDYDLNGNITGIDLRTLVYNQNNRLVRVQEGANVLGEYTYNGMGQRVRKEAGGAATIFHYDFDGNLIAESLPDGTMAFEYLYMGGNRIAMADVSSGNLYYYNNNYLGTPLLMTDSSGNVVWDADYQPFGGADVNTNSSVVNNFRFAGQSYDEETGLHYNYHRYYSLKTGRYLTPDPIGLQGGINLYTYASNNPINRIDPLGLAEYFIMWTTDGMTDPTSVVGGMKVEGTIISFELDKYNRHPARNFEGFFPGASFPFPVSKTSNVAIFKDDLPLPDFKNIEGESLIMTSISLMFGRYGLSGPSHIRFGNIYMQNMKTECGIDISAGATWTGSISLETGNELRYDPEFIQSIIIKYELK